MKFIFFPNGIKVSQDGRTICLPTGRNILIGENGEVLSSGQTDVIEKEVIYPFMHFDFIGEKERAMVARRFARDRGPNYCESFLEYRISEAIKVVDYDFYIAKNSASVSCGKIYYEENGDVATGYTKEKWENMAKQFAPEYNSDIATLHEYMLWIGYSIIQRRYDLETWSTENKVADKDPFLHTRKLVRYKDYFIRCGYNKNITSSPGKIPLKVSFGLFDDYSVPVFGAYTGVVVLRP